MKPPIPASIIKRSAAVPQANAIFILLDGIAYCEVAERTEIDFLFAYEDWKKETLPTLENSVVRFFYRTKNTKEITEALPKFPTKKRKTK